MSRPAKSSTTDCKHHFIIDTNNRGKCTECGEIRQYPTDKGDVIVIKKGRLPKRPRSPQLSSQKHNHYEQHRQEITADLLKFGRLATRKKWKIPSSSLFTLERRWLTADQKATLDRAGGGQPAAISNNGHLPPFPEFSNAWDPTVQLEWIATYGQLSQDRRPQ